MAADLDSPAITGTMVIEHKMRQIGVLLHKMRVVLHGRRNKVLDVETAEALDTGLDAVRIELAAIRNDTCEQLRLGAQALEAAHGVLKAIGAEGRLTAREPQPATFEGVYVPAPDKPHYLKDMVKSNVVILATVRRSRPDGGAR